MRWSILLLVLASWAASAQPGPEADSVARPSGVSSLSLGPLGLSASPDNGGLLLSGVRYTRSVGTGPVVVQAGATDTFYFNPFGSGSPLREVHVAAGVVTSAGPVLVSVAAGPSVGWARRSSSRDPRYADGRARTVLGVVASARAVLVVFPAVGVGVETFAQANGEVPVAGAGLTLAFGRLPGALVPNPPPRPRPARLGAR